MSTQPATNSTQGARVSPSTRGQDRQAGTDARALPQPQSGSKSAAPGVPTSRYGDNSIQTWGLEGSRAQRDRIAALVQTYLSARAIRDWRAACSYLAAKSRAAQDRLAAGMGCAKGMALLVSSASSAELTEEAEISVLSLRVGGGYAFLIYRRPDGIFATGLAREGGDWQIVNPTANPVG